MIGAAYQVDEAELGPIEDPAQLAVFNAIPERGYIEYWKLVRATGLSEIEAQRALLDLSIAARIFVRNAGTVDVSLVARGRHPRPGDP